MKFILETRCFVLHIVNCSKEKMNFNKAVITNAFQSGRVLGLHLHVIHFESVECENNGGFTLAQFRVQPASHSIAAG